MITVYLEKPNCWAQEIAVFVDENAYAAAVKGLEEWARNINPRYIITERVEDDE